MSNDLPDYLPLLSREESREQLAAKYRDPESWPSPPWDAIEERCHALASLFDDESESLAQKWLDLVNGKEDHKALSLLCDGAGAVYAAIAAGDAELAARRAFLLGYHYKKFDFESWGVPEEDAVRQFVSAQQGRKRGGEKRAHDKDVRQFADAKLEELLRQGKKPSDAVRETWHAMKAKFLGRDKLPKKETIRDWAKPIQKRIAAKSEGC